MIKTLLLAAAFASLASAQKIAGGPLVVNVGTRTATVVWLVEDDRVTLQPSAGGATRTTPAFRVEKTTFTALQPNTQYDFNVTGQESGKGSFKTALQGAGAYNFVVYGDSRTRHDVHRKVIQELLKQGMPDFVVNTGDQTEDAADNSLWPMFFDIERELLRHAAFYPSLGNHEHNSRNYYDYFQAAKPYYSFDWGNAHFTVINSDLGNVGSTKVEKDAFWSEQTQWLEEDLKTHQNAAFRFVAGHHAPFTAVARRQGDNPHMIALVPMFEKYRVTAGLFGHDHNYQHYLKDGIHYLVSGGMGAPLYDVDKPPAGITQKVASIENFIKVSVEGAVAHVKVVAIDGSTLEAFDIQGAAAAAAGAK